MDSCVTENESPLDGTSTNHSEHKCEISLLLPWEQLSETILEHTDAFVATMSISLNIPLIIKSLRIEHLCVKG